MKKILLGLVIFLVLAVAAGGIWLKRVNRFQVEGKMNLPMLDAPVEVVRDVNGIPYIFAENTPDLFRAQGFITAQHRLFRMEVTKYVASGRFAEIMGEGVLDSDITFRTMGIRRNAEQHLAKLSPESKAFLTHYVEGVNAYIENYKEEHPFELSLLGLEPTPWTALDIVCIMHFASFAHSVNFRTEIVAQKLIDVLGLERAQQIMPVNIGADRVARPRIDAVLAYSNVGVQDGNATMPASVGLHEDAFLIDLNLKNLPRLGSNNWAVAPGKSASGSAMVSSDPHFDVRILPGLWHPVGLFSPEIQAIGASVPGLPGLWIGRTAHVAFGITNAYGDVQDLYIETVDPDDGNRYLEGETAVAFEVRRETIKIKDKNMPDGYRDHMIEIRSTRRGPVITGLLPGIDSPHVLTLRWVPAEAVGSEIGLNKLLTARTVTEFDAAVQLIDVLMFNWGFADRSGGIGFRASGMVPKRANGDGTVPYKVTGKADNWTGYIPKDEMPGVINPKRGWAGTANHDTRPDNYDYYYSSYFSPSYRYRRLKELMADTPHVSVDDHFRFMTDIKNLQSRVLLPRIITALDGNVSLLKIFNILKEWDGSEAVDHPAPLIYHEIYWRLAHATFVDDLGEKLAGDMLDAWYFWQERFDVLLQIPQANWFDDRRTSSIKETADDLILNAASDTVSALLAQYGSNPEEWQWGKAHRIRFFSPLRKKGFGTGLMGGKDFARSGSFETLNRAGYKLGSDYDVTFSDSLRFVADLGDEEKVEAILPGGFVGRHFTRHFNDQMVPFHKGERFPWWFSRKAVEAHAVHRVTLMPLVEVEVGIQADEP